LGTVPESIYEQLKKVLPGGYSYGERAFLDMVAKYEIAMRSQPLTLPSAAVSNPSIASRDNDKQNEL
jgi:hypothetical protein